MDRELNLLLSDFIIQLKRLKKEHGDCMICVKEGIDEMTFEIEIGDEIGNRHATAFAGL